MSKPPFSNRYEHQHYKEAQERLEETHREKVTRVMKDWSDLEERYQDMRATDPRGADAFKQRMTQRFQQTVQALEEEGDAEKHQLAAMHQQRVLAHINQRKKEAMTCYTQAVNDQPPNVSSFGFLPSFAISRFVFAFRPIESRNASRSCSAPCTRTAPTPSLTTATSSPSAWRRRNARSPAPWNG